MSTSNKKDNKYQIAVIPGDGIGKEVMEATISVLDELNVDFDYVYGIAGDECKAHISLQMTIVVIDIFEIIHIKHNQHPTPPGHLRCPVQIAALVQKSGKSIQLIPHLITINKI